MPGPDLAAQVNVTNDLIRFFDLGPGGGLHATPVDSCTSELMMKLGLSTLPME